MSSPMHCRIWYSAKYDLWYTAYYDKYITVSLSDIANSLRTAKIVQVVWQYVLHMCVLYSICVLPLSQLSTHHSGISVIPVITADGSPHTIQIHFYCTIQLGSASLQSQRACKYTQKKWVKLECCWPSLLRQLMKVNVLQTIGSAGHRNFDKCAH